MTRLRIAPFLATAALAYAVVPTFAGPIGWPEGDGVILDHPPNQLGGPSSDTLFRYPFNDPFWQQLADDFILTEAATLRRVSWHGFYGGTLDPPPAEPPPATETMRIRIYDARPSDGLPGIVLFDESFVDPSRVPTGDHIPLGIPHLEYIYQVNLTTPINLTANIPYWLEIVQVGDLDSHFRARSKIT